MPNHPCIFDVEIQVGNNDLRASAIDQGGFRHLVLRDADDGDVIIINEDDLIALRQYLNTLIAHINPA